MKTEFTDVDFLKNEYDFLFDYLKYKYDERDKYVRFFIAISSALIAVLGYIYTVNEAKPLVMVLLVALSITGLSIFLLKKLVYSRIRAIEYKKKLNAIRRILWQRSGGNEAVKSAILSTDPSHVKYYEERGGDASVFYFLTIIAAVSIAADIGVVSFLILSHSFFAEVKWIVEYAKLITGSASLIVLWKVFRYLSSLWKKWLEDEDKKSKSNGN